MSEMLDAVERERLELLAGDPREAFNDYVAKLLRIHDAQQKRIAECERLLQSCSSVGDPLSTEIELYRIDDPKNPRW